MMPFIVSDKDDHTSWFVLEISKKNGADWVLLASQRTTELAFFTFDAFIFRFRFNSLADVTVAR